MYRALIVEDDEDLAAITQVHLAHGGYQTDIAHTCQAALALLDKQDYDLILLDEILPDDRGDSLCRTIRDHSMCPIIFMSCLDDSNTIISALKAGGDDYMVKPLDYDELMARADAIIRRSGGRRKEENLRVFHQFSIDTQRHKVVRGEEVVDLSSIEYALLLYMTEHPNSLLLYNELYQNVWASESLGDVRTVMVHISNLRKKIDPDRTGIIETVRGAGYIFTDV